MYGIHAEDVGCDLSQQFLAEHLFQLIVTCRGRFTLLISLLTMFFTRYEA